MDSTVEKDRVVGRILTEDVVSLTEARKEIQTATGHHIDKATLYRWCKYGVGGTELEHIVLGKRIYTSRQAITRFIAARSK